MRWMVALGAAGLAMGLLAPNVSHAADPGFCRDYARRAVNQARIARESPRCDREARGPRWSMDYRVHFDWCLNARGRDVEMERERRREFLESCRRY